MTPPDPAEATARFDRRLVEAVVEVSEPGAAVQVCEVRLTPAGRRALEVGPGPVRKVSGALFGGLAALPLLFAIGVLLVLGCGWPLGCAATIGGGTADDPPPPPGCCRCP